MAAVVMVTVTGKLMSVGSLSDGEECAEIQLKTGRMVDVRGLTRDQVRALAPSLFEEVTITIARTAGEVPL